MSSIRALLLIVTLVWAQDVSPDERGYIVRIGDSVPDFEFYHVNGKLARLSDYLGTPVMLQFTASWCSVCREEMPHIEKEIWRRFKDQGLIVIGVDRDEPLEIVKDFAKEMNITYPLVLDPGAEIFGLFASKESGVTRNVLIDRHGKIVFLTRLFEEEEFHSLVEKIGELFLPSNQ